MNRIAQLDPAQAAGKTKQLFDAAQARLGGVPNLFRVLGNAPAAGLRDGEIVETIANVVRNTSPTTSTAPPEPWWTFPKSSRATVTLSQRVDAPERISGRRVHRGIRSYDKGNKQEPTKANAA